MSDEVPLREHLEAMVEGLRREVHAAEAAAQAAVDKALAAVDTRFASVNEFRATLSDQAGHFLTRETFEAQHAELVRELQNMRGFVVEQGAAAMSRETADVQHANLERQVDMLRERVDALTVAREAVDRQRAQSQARTQWAVGTALTVLIVAMTIGTAVLDHLVR